jgi:hypothetical protein
LIPKGVLSTESTFCALLLSFGLLLIGQGMSDSFHLRLVALSASFVD